MVCGRSDIVQDQDSSAIYVIISNYTIIFHVVVYLIYSLSTPLLFWKPALKDIHELQVCWLRLGQTSTSRMRYLYDIVQCGMQFTSQTKYFRMDGHPSLLQVLLDIMILLNSLLKRKHHWMSKQRYHCIHSCYAYEHYKRCQVYQYTCDPSRRGGLHYLWQAGGDVPR